MPKNLAVLTVLCLVCCGLLVAVDALPQAPIQDHFLHHSTDNSSFSDLSYYPRSHDFGDKYEGETDNTTFEIWNSGCCGLTYLFIEECGWVSVHPQGGHSYGEKDTITVTINTTGLAVGDYQCHILIDSSDIDGIFMVNVSVIKPPNIPPNVPLISGPTTVVKGTEHYFSAEAEDVDGSYIWYKWDWDDGTTSNWYGPFESGYNQTLGHTYDQEGYFNIRVKSKDLADDESDWSEPMLIHASKQKTLFNLFNYYLHLFFEIFISLYSI